MKFVCFMRILLFKIGALGDVLMTAPLVRQLRRNFPYAKIDYLIGKSSSIILKNNKHINSIIKFDESTFTKRKLLSWFKLISKIKKKKYDLIFVLDKHWIFNLTAFFFRIKKRIGFDRIGKEGIFLTDKIHYEKVRHEVYYYLDLLKFLDVKADYKDFKYDLFLSKKDKDFADKVWEKNKLSGKKVIGIAPGGGNVADKWSYMRIYPVKKYIKLIKKLLKKGYYIILLGKSKEDIIIANKISNSINSKKILNFIDKTNIYQTAALMQKCSRIYCNDSGAMHIAASVNENIHSFFIVTHPLKKAPLWKRSSYKWLYKNIYNPKCELFGDYNKYKKYL